MLCRCVRGGQVKLAVVDAPVILAPVHFTGIRGEIGAADMMVRADLRATDAAKETLGLIGAAFAIRIDFAVIDALGEIPGV